MKNIQKRFAAIDRFTFHFLFFSFPFFSFLFFSFLSPFPSSISLPLTPPSPPQIHGAIPGAMETFLAIRGCRTLALRLEKASENAMILAERLEKHPMVLKVRYPGLVSHPQYEIAKGMFDRGLFVVVVCCCCF